MSAAAKLLIGGLVIGGGLALASSFPKKEKGGNVLVDRFSGVRRLDKRTADQLLASTLSAFTFTDSSGTDPVTGDALQGIRLTSPGSPPAIDWVLGMNGSGLWVLTELTILTPVQGPGPILYATDADTAERIASDPAGEMAILLEGAA